MLNGRAVLVTGASRGIGRATAIAFAQSGAKVVAAARHGIALESVATEIDRLGGTCLTVEADVTDEESVRQLIERAVAAFGGIDVLVNNAGTIGYGPMEHASLHDWEAIIGTNLRGPFLCARAVIPVMTAQGGGHIINVASQAGLYGFANLAIYCASKFGLVGLSQSLGRELASARICVTYVCPGYVDTGMLAAVPQELVAKAPKVSPEIVAQSILRAATPAGQTSRPGWLRRIGKIWKRRFGRTPVEIVSSC